MHQWRTHIIENFIIENFIAQFKGIFDCSQAVPTKGLIATARQVLGAVPVYQLALLLHFQTGGGLWVGIQALVQEA